MSVDLECDHESWDCSLQGFFRYHTCNNGCGQKWLAGARQGDDCNLCSPKVSQQQDEMDVPYEFVTKDSGKREEYDSGMVRDTQEGKAQWDLLLPLGIPYEAQFFTRVAELLTRGARKYSSRNWEKASGYAELARFKASGLRHMMQFMAGETDEDHAAAVVFNLLAYETTKWKMEYYEHGA